LVSCSPLSEIGRECCSIGVAHGAMVGVIGRLGTEISRIWYLTARSRGGCQGWGACLVCPIVSQFLRF
jgi:hypothetical protein